MGESGGNVFTILAGSLSEFRLQLELNQNDIGSIGNDPGLVPNMIRETFAAIGGVLESLYEMAVEAEEFTLQADTALALLETFAEMVEAFGGGALPDDLPGLPENMLRDIRDAIAQGGSQVGRLAEMAGSVLPRPEDITALRLELAGLLGKIDDPELEEGVRLGPLLETIGAGSAN